MQFDLSILIPARNEEWLSRTVDDLIENSSERTEIIVGLDGQWANPPVKKHPRVTVVYFPKSIGQRACTNQLCRLSTAKYVAKTDAHCSFEKGFDEILMADMQDDYTMIPTMKNLHIFDWVCDKCGNRWYQGRTPENCFADYKAEHKNEACDSKNFHREIIWKAKDSPKSRFYRFDNTLHFQYWGALEKRTGSENAIAETMSAQGSFFMLTREKYWELNICDEGHGSWGQQGTEVACKTWLSGGKLVNNNRTWYAHLFRTQGGDFGFPYKNNTVTQAREYSKSFWKCNLEELKKKWPPAKHDLAWLLEKFAPIPGWELTKGVIYYTDSKIEDTPIAPRVREQIRKSFNGRIVSVSLKKLDWGDNIHLPLQRGYITMVKQILAGLREHDCDVIFFCEHDVLYTRNHFKFTPEKMDTFYYNTNVWKARFEDGHAMRVDDMRQLSGLCVNRELAIKHYEKVLSLLETKAREVGEDSEEFRKYVRHIGFEPGTHNRVPELNAKSETWEARSPNVDIRHENTLTPSRWNKEQFKNEKYTKGWLESDIIPSWGKLTELFK